MTPATPVEQSDFDALLELLDGETMREVVAMFAGSAPDRLVVARDGIAVRDVATVATAFHTLRSGCGQLGARHLEALCANAERTAKSGDFEATSLLLGQVEHELARCLGWFRDGGWLSA